MHHTLRLYSRYREAFLRYYIFQAGWTRIPVIGELVRKAANYYGQNHCAYALTHEDAIQIIDASPSVSLGPCACRSVFRNCDNPTEGEIIVGTGTNVFTEERPQDYRQVSKQEAKEVLLLGRQRHLVPTIVRCSHDFYAICNCCPCCCVPLRLKNNYGIGNALVRNPEIVDVFRSSVAS